MAVTSISIGKIIYSAITTDAVLSPLVGSKVFPLVAENDTTFPFVVYSRTNLYTNTLSKDGFCDDRVNFSLTVVSDSYNDSITVSEALRDLFENCIISSTDLKMYDVRLISASEAYNEDTYTQILNFECFTE